MKDELDITKGQLEEAKVNSNDKNELSVELERLKIELTTLSEAKNELEQTNQSLKQSIETLKTEPEKVPKLFIRHLKSEEKNGTRSKIGH